MRIGLIDVSGITRIVENRKVVWERYRNRWVKFVDGYDEPRGGMSMEEMHIYLNRCAWGDSKEVWVHNETINIKRIPSRIKECDCK